MPVDDIKSMAKEMADLETSIAEAQRTLNSFKEVKDYLAHRNGDKHIPVGEVKEPKLLEAPEKPPTIADGKYRAGSWDRAIRDAVEAGADKELWQAICRHTTFPITYENGASQNL